MQRTADLSRLPRDTGERRDLTVGRDFAARNFCDDRIDAGVRRHCFTFPPSFVFILCGAPVVEATTWRRQIHRAAQRHHRRGGRGRRQPGGLLRLAPCPDRGGTRRPAAASTERRSAACLDRRAMAPAAWPARSANGSGSGALPLRAARPLRSRLGARSLQRAGTTPRELRAGGRVRELADASRIRRLMEAFARRVGTYASIWWAAPPRC